jgi:hypothetical protein
MTFSHGADVISHCCPVFGQGCRHTEVTCYTWQGNDHRHSNTQFFADELPERTLKSGIGTVDA